MTINHQPSTINHNPVDILALHEWIFSPNSALLVTGIAALAMATGGTYLALLKKRPESTVLNREDSQLQRRLNRIENWSLSLRASYRLVLALMLCGAAVWVAVAADEELTVKQAALSYSLGLVAILLAVGSLLWGRNERKAFESIGAHRNSVRPPGLAIYGQVCALRSFEGQGDPPALYPLLYQSTVSRLANLSLEKELPWQWKTQFRYAANAAILLGILSFLMGSLSSFVQTTASLLKENAAVNERLPMGQTPEEQLAKKEEQAPPIPPENDQQEGDSGQQKQSQSGVGTGQEQPQESTGNEQAPQPNPNQPGQPDLQKESEPSPDQQSSPDQGTEPKKSPETPQNAREKPLDPNRPPDVPPEDLKEKKTPQQNAENQQDQDPNRPPDIPPEDLKEQQPPSSGSKESPAPQNGRTADQPIPSGRPESGEGGPTPLPRNPNRAPDVPPEQLSDKQEPSPSPAGEQEVGTQDAESQQPKLKQNRTEEAKRLAQPNDDGQENHSKDFGSEPGPDPLGNGDGSSKKTAKLEDAEFQDMKLKRGPSRSPEGKPEDLEPRENEPQRASAGQRYNPRTELKANRYVEPLPISPQRVPPEYRTAFRKLFQRDE